MFAILVGPELSRPERIRITDKELAKGFIAERVGGALNVPTVAVLRSPEEAEAFDFPERCVIKPTHSSGPLIIRRAGEPVDRARIAHWFDENYYLVFRERNYRPLQPKVIVEAFALGSPDPDNFKAYCIDGEPRLFHVNVDMHGRDRKAYYDRDWVPQPFVIDSPAGRCPAAGQSRPADRRCAAPQRRLFLSSRRHVFRWRPDCRGRTHQLQRRGARHLPPPGGGGDRLLHPVG